MKIDEFLKYIKNTQENSEDIFEAKNDVVIFQYIRKHFNVKSKIAKENKMTNITLNYIVKAVNETTNQVATIGETVSAHGNFIVEQGKYNDETETNKSNCTLIIKYLEKLEITLWSEWQTTK